MKFFELAIDNCFLIKPEKKKDVRGSFFRVFCQKELEKKKIYFKIKQTNISYNKKKFTFRGFHYSSVKFIENKIINVVSGKIENHIIDLRKNSKTFLKKVKLNLDAEKNDILYIPSGCANGFLTLRNNTMVHYYMDNYFTKKKVYKGFSYDDPFFSIKLFKKPAIVSKKDKNFKAYVNNV